ncbi:MAG: transporter substrate-binding domain-containing protein [Oscillospiraceae bacterium]|nr:transporter substrate-binding domain-containing protein [Oscillospiraceae bacterium]
MKNWKKITGLALTAALALSLLTACGGNQEDGGKRLDEIKEKGVFTIATSPDFAPSEFVDSSKTGQDQYVGFDMTLARYLAEELGVELDIQAMSFDACQTAVSMGAVDAAISGFAPSDDRKENYELSIPYRASINEIDQTLLVRKSDVDKYTKPEDFDGLDIGCQNASLQYQLVTEQLPNAKPYIIGDLGVGALELQSGNIEALAVAYGNGVQICENNPDLTLCAWHFDYQSIGQVVLMAKGETKLAEAINEALAKAEEAGKYPEWYAQAMEDAKSANAIEVSIPDEE